jgi:hypothetical protein
VRDGQSIPLGFRWVKGGQMEGRDGKDDMQYYYQVSFFISLHGNPRPRRHSFDLNRWKTHHTDA